MSSAPICDGCRYSGGFIANHLLGVVFARCEHCAEEVQFPIVYDTEAGTVLLSECENYEQEAGV